MSAAVPNVAQLRSQTDAALSQLIDEGTSDGTTANLIEVLHSLCRRVEVLEAMAPQYTTITQQIVPDLPLGFSQVSTAQSTANPGAAAATVTTESPAEPAAEEATSDGISPEAAG